MMDLKEIIKWFIPCFHILLHKVKMCKFMYISCLFILLFIRPSCGANFYNSSDENTKNFVNDKYLDSYSPSDYHEISNNKLKNEEKGLEIDASVGRTFGRVKKIAQALIPLAFQIGAASTWMVVAAIIGFKTLLVSLVILKLLLLAGAAKFGVFIGQKTHTHGHGWEPPHQKEIHLHIHGQQGPHEEHISSWNRDGATSSLTDTKSVNLVLNPYAGPQTISTPYGNYVKVDPHNYNQGLTSPE